MVGLHHAACLFPGVASELALTARVIKGEEARQVGLVSQCFADETALLQHAHKTAELIASKSPLAVVGTKRVLVHARYVYTMKLAPFEMLMKGFFGLFARKRSKQSVPAQITLLIVPLSCDHESACRRSGSGLDNHMDEPWPLELLLLCRDHSVPDGLDYVAAYNAAMLPSSDIQEVFKAVVKERRMPKFSKL